MIPAKTDNGLEVIFIGSRNCNYIYEDEDILKADAILFYLHGSWTKLQQVLDMIELPRLKSQRWVYLSDESQSYTPLYPHYEGDINGRPSYQSMEHHNGIALNND